MNSYDTFQGRHAFRRAICIALVVTLLVPTAYAQGISEFGSGTATTIIVDAPARRKSIDQPETPEQAKEKNLEEIVTTGRRIASTKWAITPALSRSEDRKSLGVELAAKRDREYNHFRLLSLAYSNIDPDGAAGPFNQARVRFRDKFFSSNKGWGAEGMVQIVRRWDSYVEPAVQLNVGFKLSDWTSFGANLGYIWRDRDNGTTLKDSDTKFAVRQTLNLKNSFRVSADYRVRNDVTGEDDFSVGFELLDQWYLSVGKHWVATLSYVHALNATR